MKLRTQLILAFVVLAILPLSGIVVYNYLSSLETFRRLVELESHQMTEEIGRNMEDARGSLQRQWEGLGRLRLEHPWWHYCSRWSGSTGS